MADKYNAGYYEKDNYVIGEMEDGTLLGPAFYVYDNLKNFEIGEFANGGRHGWICSNGSKDDTDTIYIDKWEENKHILSPTIMSSKAATNIALINADGQLARYVLWVWNNGCWAFDDINKHGKHKRVFYDAETRGLYMQFLNDEKKKVEKSVRIGQKTLRHDFKVPYSYFHDKVFAKPGNFKFGDEIIYSENDGPAFMWSNEDDSVRFGNVVKKHEQGIIVTRSEEDIRFSQIDKSAKDGPEIFICKGEDGNDAIFYAFYKKDKKYPLEFYLKFKNDGCYVSASYYTDEDTFDSIDINEDLDVLYIEDDHNQSDDTGPETTFNFKATMMGN